MQSRRRYSGRIAYPRSLTQPSLTVWMVPNPPPPLCAHSNFATTPGFDRLILPWRGGWIILATVAFGRSCSILLYISVLFLPGLLFSSMFARQVISSARRVSRHGLLICEIRVVMFWLITLIFSHFASPQLIHLRRPPILGPT